MLDEMLAYSVGCLDALADLMISEPFIYIFGFLIAACTVKIIKQIGGF